MQDELGFLTTLGREFTSALASVDGAAELSGVDVYDVFFEVLNGPPSIECLKLLAEPDLEHIRDAFNANLECFGVTTEHIKSAVDAVIWHWDDQGCS